MSSSSNQALTLHSSSLIPPPTSDPNTSSNALSLHSYSYQRKDYTAEEILHHIAQREEDRRTSSLPAPTIHLEGHDGAILTCKYSPGQGEVSLKFNRS